MLRDGSRISSAETDDDSVNSEYEVGAVRVRGPCLARCVRAQGQERVTGVSPFPPPPLPPM